MKYKKIIFISIYFFPKFPVLFIYFTLYFLALKKSKKWIFF